MLPSVSRPGALASRPPVSSSLPRLCWGRTEWLPMFRPLSKLVAPAGSATVCSARALDCLSRRGCAAPPHSKLHNKLHTLDGSSACSLTRATKIKGQHRVWGSHAVHSSAEAAAARSATERAQAAASKEAALAAANELDMFDDSEDSDSDDNDTDDEANEEVLMEALGYPR